MYVALAGSDTPMHQSGCATHTYVCMYTVVYAVLYTSMTRHVRTVYMYVRVCTYVHTYVDITGCSTARRYVRTYQPIVNKSL